MANIVVALEDAALAGVLQAELEGEGHAVLSAATGYEAYELALEAQPMFVFLGARLAVFDGLATCEMIRNDPELPKDLAVILVVGQDVDSKALERAGVSEVLPEQHEAGQVREMLGKYLVERV